MIEMDRIEVAIVELSKHPELIDYDLLDKIDDNYDDPGPLMRLMQENWIKEAKNMPVGGSIWDYPINVVDKEATLARLIRELDESFKK